jgi:hypothetical protein
VTVTASLEVDMHRHGITLLDFIALSNSVFANDDQSHSASVDTWIASGRLRAKLPVELVKNLKAEIPSLTGRSFERFTLTEESGTKFTVSVYEPFAMGGRKFEREVTADATSLGVSPTTKRTRIQSDAGLYIYEFVPAPSRTTIGSVLIYLSYIRNVDSTVHLIAYHLDSSSLKELGVWVRLARKITRTLVATKFATGYPSNEASIGYRDDAKLISIPQGWVFRNLSDDEGIVYMLRQIGSLKTAGNSCVFTLSAHTADSNEASTNLDIMKGHIGNNDVSWRKKRVDQRIQFETQVAALWRTFDAHILCSSPDDSGVQETLKVLASIRPEETH